ncbi:c-type cytochrome [Marinobacterium rhizophilum]|uniref:c-type cytochrome n=1 Tax=Marinobacterium rhizophilum TaxID=420402 RepID=UPI0003803F57|nr:c-type cytochrome [Marinobacterium rhizophilum]
MVSKTKIALLCLLGAVGGNGAGAEDETEVPQVAQGCAACHQREGVPAMPGWPYLAGMEKTRLVDILRGHRDNLVPGSTMDQVATMLTDREIDAVADYFSKLDRTDPPPFPALQPAPE